MLKGSHTAIVISVLLHLLIIAALTYSAIKQPKINKQTQPNIIPIKSFLYTAPKKVVIKKSIAKKNLTKQSTDEKSLLPKLSSKKKPPTKAVSTERATVLTTKITTKVVTKSPSTQVTNAVKSDTVTTKNKVAGASQGSFSSYDRLSQLRLKLDKQQREQAFAELTQKRSASVMDAEQFLVPKAIVPLTVDQQKKLNTSSSHVGSITKNDNGTCTIYREQMLGSPVPATTAFFACGESKFDKSFRQHMQKVQAKYKVPNK